MESTEETQAADTRATDTAVRDARVTGTRTGALITAEELAAELRAGVPLTLLDARYYLPEPGRGRREYEAAHVPGAVFLDLDTDLAAHSEGPGGRHPLPTPEAFGAAMRRLGVRRDVPVVVYDQKTSLSAARAWWMLTDAGHPDVRVLDGGFRAWRSAGGAVAEGDETASEGDFAPQPSRRPVVTAEQIPSLLADGHHLFDVRAPERYRGETEPIDPVAGHIPGADNLPATELFNSDGTVKDAESLRPLVAHVQPGDAVSCGSGVTAAQVLLALDTAGIEGVALYTGSWSDWISDPSRPVATGTGR